LAELSPQAVDEIVECEEKGYELRARGDCHETSITAHYLELLWRRPIPKAIDGIDAV